MVQSTKSRKNPCDYWFSFWCGMENWDISAYRLALRLSYQL